MDAAADAAPDPDGRDETPNERSDRNWTEILQEFRVTQTGTQILSGFLLTVAFQARFSELSQTQVDYYVALVVLAAATTVVGLAPVGLHRALFRRHEKARIVSVGSRLLIVDLVLVSLLTAGVVFFLLDVTLGLLAGLFAGGAVLLLLVGLLVVLPWVTGRRRL